MQISIILATYNRCESLKNTLNSFLSLDDNEGVDWELLVIDNNSTDDTKSLVEKFSNISHGQIRYIREERNGKSYALNAGLKAALGDIFAFTDDDVTFEPFWLKNILKNFADPKTMCLTGKITPVYPKTLPSWYSEKCSSVMGNVDSSPTKTTVNYVTGANMAMRNEVFRKIGQFNISTQLINEDTFLSQQITNHGFSIVYDPEIEVYHYFQPEKMTKAYFKKWYWLSGLSISALNHEKDKSEKCLFHVTRWRYRRALEHLGSMVTNLFNEKERFYHELQFRRFLAYCSYRWKMKS